MIHIDELFRHRMEDREASPGPGAWSNMRNLLDKELPVTPAATNWRRIFGYFTGVLLLASASVGGYSLYSDQLQSNLGTAPSALRVSNTAIGGGMTASAMTANYGAEALRNATSSANAPTAGDMVTRSAASGALEAGSASASPAQAAQTTPSSSTIASSNRSSTSVDGSHHSGQGTTSAVAAARTHVAANKTTHPVNSVNSASSSTAAEIGARRSEVSSNASTTAGGSGLALASHTRRSPEVLPNAATPHSGTARTKATAGRPAPLAASTRAASGSNATPDLEFLNSGGAVTVPPTMLRRLDTIQRIEIIGRLIYAAGSRRPVYRLDTLPAEYVVVERLIPVLPSFASNAAPDAPAHKPKPANAKGRKEPLAPDQTFAASSSKPTTDPVPAASAAKDPANDANSASNLAAKISGNHLNFWQSLRLDEKVEKAKASLQSVQLYPGVIAGINMTMFTPNSLGGFQLGLTSLIAINDYWSVLGELKYVHRFNTGSSVRDDYYNVDESTVTPVAMPEGNFNRYEWKQAKVDHYFNYETIQTIELPIMLRYNNNRFFAQSGLNFVSSRAINAREVTNQAGPYVPAPIVLVPESSSLNPLPNTKPNVTIADFGSRLGLGYTLGAGYMFTPSVFFDFRMTQTFWDNAKTPGAVRISQDLLRKPSFQISVGYRFGTSKERP